MPPTKRNAASQPHESVPADEKIARLLGLLLVKDMEQKTDQVALLRSIGFEVAEVAAMLGMTENHVNVAAYHGRKNLGKKKSK
jgi:hypothetical protein